MIFSASALALGLLLAGPARAQDGAAGANSGAALSDLDRAYQKEFAFLHAEKASLQARLAELQAERARRVGGADGELDRLQGRLLSLTRQADAAEALLADTQRAGDRATEGAQVLETTLSQAAATLERPELVPAEGEAGGVGAGGPVDGAATEAQARALASLFTVAAEDLARGGALRTVPGEVFLAGGTAARGTVVEVGEVARFAVVDGQGAALVPAGEGRLRVAPGLGAAEATALSAGSVPEVVGLHLYESLSRRVEDRAEKTLSDWMAAGGLIGWVIMGLGAVAVIMATIRAAILLAAGRGVEALGARVAEALARGRADEALSAARQAGGPGGRLLSTVVAAWQAAPAAGREYLDGVATEALLREAPAIDRFAATLKVISAVAPLLGLLGTVTGMIGTFELITEFGTGDPRMLSTGISLALVTTQQGLVVAIPTLLVGNVLKGRADAVIEALEAGVLSALNAVDPDRPQVIEAPAVRAPAAAAAPEPAHA